MNRSKASCVALAVALISAPALAVKEGGTLYIRSKDTKVLKTAKANGATVATLQPGTEVTWQGADKTDKTFHSIKAGAKAGFVLQANLTPVKPATEVTGDGKTIDAHAFASTGAATRAMSDSGQSLVVKKPELSVAAQQIVELELISGKALKDTKGACELAVKQGLSKEVCK